VIIGFLSAKTQNKKSCIFKHIKGDRELLLSLSAAEAVPEALRLTGNGSRPVPALSSI
jgi:hypothetical protein